MERAIVQRALQGRQGQDLPRQKKEAGSPSNLSISKPYQEHRKTSREGLSPTEKQPQAGHQAELTREGNMTLQNTVKS